MASSTIEHIVIVGGGSAGWLTAGVIAAEHPHLAVTLIESPDVAPIGVGEGTWPTMRDTLRKIGVSESDFFRECDAAFKQGSKFSGWVTGQETDYYFHPFVLPQGYGETNLAARWQERHGNVPFADLSLQLSPITATTWTRESSACSCASIAWRSWVCAFLPITSQASIRTRTAISHRCRRSTTAP
jgi:hypothetical protein